MLALKQTCFRINKIVQMNRIVQINRIVQKNRIFQIYRIVKKKQDHSEKQISSRKQTSTRNQTTSTKTNIFIARDIDPNIPCVKLQLVWGETVKSEIDDMIAKMIIDEFLRFKNITRKHYNILCEKVGMVYF